MDRGNDCGAFATTTNISTPTTTTTAATTTARTDDNSPSNASVGPRILRYCSRCRNHGLKIAQKGHIKECMYRQCNCKRCKIIAGQFDVMAAEDTTFKNEFQPDEESTLLVVDEDLPSPVVTPQPTVMGQGVNYDNTNSNSSTSSNLSVVSSPLSTNGLPSLRTIHPIIHSIAWTNTWTNTRTNTWSNTWSNTSSNASSNASSNVSSNGSFQPGNSKTTRTLPNCVRCRNHNMTAKLKGHKRYCPRRYCTCVKCINTAERQQKMAVQTALRRALEQDEQLMKTYKEKLLDPNGPPVPNGYPLPPAVPPPVGSLEGSLKDNISDTTPIGNHINSNSVDGTGVNDVVITPAKQRQKQKQKQKTQPIQKHEDSTIQSEAQYTENTETLLEHSMKLVQLFQYPMHTVPLMYVIVKNAKANLEEAAKSILEALKTRNSFAMQRTATILFANFASYFFS